MYAETHFQTVLVLVLVVVVVIVVVVVFGAGFWVDVVAAVVFLLLLLGLLWWRGLQLGFGGWGEALAVCLRVWARVCDPCWSTNVCMYLSMHV